MYKKSTVQSKDVRMTTQITLVLEICHLKKNAIINCSCVNRIPPRLRRLSKIRSLQGSEQTFLRSQTKPLLPARFLSILEQDITRNKLSVHIRNHLQTAQQRINQTTVPSKSHYKVIPPAELPVKTSPSLQKKLNQK